MKMKRQRWLKEGQKLKWTPRTESLPMRNVRERCIGAHWGTGGQEAWSRQSEKELRLGCGNWPGEGCGSWRGKSWDGSYPLEGCGSSPVGTARRTDGRHCLEESDS